MRYPYYDFMPVPRDFPASPKCFKCGANDILLLSLGDRFVCHTCASSNAEAVDPPGLPGGNGREPFEK